MKALRPPPAASPVTYLFRFRYPRDSSVIRARCFQRSRGGEGPSRARIIVQPAILIAGPLSRGREWNISGSQAIHPVPLLRSKTPAESRSLAVTVSSMLPLLFRRQRLQRWSYRGYRGASAPAVYASRGMLPLPVQDSLPAGWLAFTGGELNPLDCDERFPSCYISSPFPGFILTLGAIDPGHWGPWRKSMSCVDNAPHRLSHS